jgi:hypothetical protein
MQLPDPRNVRGLQRNSEGERKWSHDLLDVVGDGSTCVQSSFSSFIRRTDLKKSVLPYVALVWSTLVTVVG